MTVKDLYVKVRLALNDNPEQHVKVIVYDRDGDAHGPVEFRRTSGGGLNTLMIIGEAPRAERAEPAPGVCPGCGGDTNRGLHAYGCPRSPRDE